MYIVNPYIVAPPFDADAQAFITAASITDPTQQSAVNQLVVDLKAASIWTKMKAVYPFVSDGIGAARSSQHKWNLKDPRDLDAAYRLSFVGGYTHNINGITGNGINTFSNTFIVPSVRLTANSTHLSFYSRTNIAEGSTEIGCSDTYLPIMGFSPRTALDQVVFDSYDFTAHRLTPSNTNSTGFYVGSVVSSTSQKIYKNGISLANQTAAQTQGLPSTASITLSARNDGGGLENLSSRNIAFASIGDGLSDTDVSNLYTAVQTFQTTLGRSVGTQTVSDSDAQAFVTAADIQDQVQAEAVNQLVVDLKAASIWTKMYAVYPMVGGASSTHKWNLKTPVDTNPSFRLSFQGGWTHSSTGALPNGTNAYADTFFNTLLSASTQNDFHLSYYSRTNESNDCTDIGSSGAYLLYSYLGSGYKAFNSTQSLRGSVFTPTNGLLIGSRTSSTSEKYFHKGTKIDDLTVNSITPSNDNVYLANVPSASNWSGKECAFASIGQGLSDSEALALYNAVQTFNTTLSRNV